MYTLSLQRVGTVQYSTVQYSTVQYSTVQYSTVHELTMKFQYSIYCVYIITPKSRYSTVQYSTVQYSTVQYSTVQYSTVQYSTVHELTMKFQYSIYCVYIITPKSRLGTVQYSTVQYSTVQYSTVQYSTVIIIIIIEAFIKRRIPGKTTCSKALQYRGSYKN